MSDQFLKGIPNKSSKEEVPEPKPVEPKVVDHEKQVVLWLYGRIVNFLRLIRDNGMDHHKSALKDLDSVPVNNLISWFERLMAPVLNDKKIKQIVKKWTDFWTDNTPSPTEGFQAVEKAKGVRKQWASENGADLLDCLGLISDHLPFLLPTASITTSVGHVHTPQLQLHDWAKNLDSDLQFTFMRYICLFVDARGGYEDETGA